MASTTDAFECHLLPPPTPVLDRLRPDEHARVLRELLRGHPELRLGAEQAATALLRQASADEVAGRVVIALGEFGLDDLAARSGRIPGGYVEPTEAACELVLDALAPIEAELRRCLELDLHAAARQTLLGLLAASTDAAHLGTGPSLPVRAQTCTSSMPSGSWTRPAASTSNRAPQPAISLVAVISLLRYS
jgi:hypothetical protein